MSRQKLSLALLAGTGLALSLATQALAYGPQVPHTITVTPAQPTFVCEHPTAVTATVLDQDGKPIKAITVTWSLTTSPSRDDRILQKTSKTDKHGVAKTMLKLACVAGDRVITASAGGVHGTAVIHVQISKHDGKPRAAVLGVSSVRMVDSTPTAASTVPLGVPATAWAAAIALILGAGFILRRNFSHR